MSCEHYLCNNCFSRLPAEKLGSDLTISCPLCKKRTEIQEQWHVDFVKFEDATPEVKECFIPEMNFPQLNLKELCKQTFKITSKSKFTTIHEVFLTSMNKQE